MNSAEWALPVQDEFSHAVPRFGVGGSDLRSPTRRRAILSARATVVSFVRQSALPDSLEAGGAGGFVGVGIGLDPTMTGRSRVPHYVVRIETDLPAVTDAVAREFPNGIDAVTVRIVRTAPFLLALGHAGAQTTFLHPRIGICAASTPGQIGSFGCVLRRGGADLGLTAAHLLPKDWSAGTMPVTCLDPKGRAGAVIGHVDRADVRIPVDACLVTLDPLQVQAANVLPFREPKHLARGPERPLRYMQVAKFGARTGYTTGRIVSADVSAYLIGDDGAVDSIDDIFIVEAPFFSRGFSDTGDSGAVVFERHGRRPVGMVLATDGRRSVCVPMGSVLAVFPGAELP